VKIPVKKLWPLLNPIKWHRYKVAIFLKAFLPTQNKLLKVALPGANRINSSFFEKITFDKLLKVSK